ncbi:tetratricopeptide repeat protein [Hyunsoonleella sp. SJ7]|uniref:Tetratricopeptide repeat protein n=1 Tax=Hyunsoonleella aquatilis TaxID=2762758 RepID=A0A923HCH2_9FLAO|nr:tetratricopeptide repeat protein [Hyunsoonleella aquatilis]MBC3757543.1 tetratricopeptide repeat protein [Hyunsoonleella aquatilis]
MKPFSFAIFLCFLALNYLSSQNEKQIDSLLQTYKSQPESIEKAQTAHELFRLHRHKSPKDAFKYARLGLQLSKKINYDKGIGLGYLNLAYYYRFLPNQDSSRYYFEKSTKKLAKTRLKETHWFALNEYAIFETIQGDFDKALKLADEGYDIALALNHGTHMVDNLQRKATIYMDNGEFKLAMEETLKANKVLDTITPENKVGKAIALADIGRIEMLRGNYKKAIAPLEASLEKFKGLDRPYWESTMFMEVANVYWYLKEYDKALENYKESLRIGQKIKRDDLVAANYSNMADIYSRNGEHKKALNMLEKSQAITKKIGSTNNLIIGHNQIGEVAVRIKDYKRAIKNYSKGIQLADSINALDVIRDSYHGRSIANEKLGNYVAALSDQRQYQIYNDSLFNETKAKQIDELKAQYEAEKREQQIQLQKREIDLLEKKSEINTLYMVLLGFGLLLSLIGFYALRQKLKRSKTEKEKLNLELDFKKKELTTHALHLAKKNEVLENLKQQAQEFKTSENSKRGFNKLIRTIDFDLKDDNNWENFSRYFEQVHKDFNSTVKQKFPEVTSNELRLMALLKMNLSSKEIANILNVSPEGIKKARYRLRKKLGITTEDSLQDLVLSL